MSDKPTYAFKTANEICAFLVDGDGTRFIQDIADISCQVWVCGTQARNILMYHITKDESCLVESDLDLFSVTRQESYFENVFSLLEVSRNKRVFTEFLQNWTYEFKEDKNYEMSRWVHNTENIQFWKEGSVESYVRNTVKLAGDSIAINLMYGTIHTTPEFWTHRLNYPYHEKNKYRKEKMDRKNELYKFYEEKGLSPLVK